MARNDDNYIRSINVDRKEWLAAKEKARAEGTTLSRIIRNALRAYLSQK